MSLNVKQCDVTPIIVQYAKNINKEFMTTEEEMSMSTNDKNGANNNEDGPKSEFQIAVEKLKRRFESRVTPYGHKHKESNNSNKKQQYKNNNRNNKKKKEPLRIYFKQNKIQDHLEWKNTNECDLFIYYIQQTVYNSNNIDLNYIFEPPSSIIKNNNNNNNNKKKKMNKKKKRKNKQFILDQLPPFLFYFPWNNFILKNNKLKTFLNEYEHSIFYVVPPQIDEDKDVDAMAPHIWICGNFKKNKKNDFINLMVANAIKNRDLNQSFCTVAKNFNEAKKMMERKSNRIDYLFSKLQPSLRKQLKLDNTAMFSVTDEITADETTKLISKHVVDGRNKNIAIIDATSCVGGNLFSFTKYYHHVLGIELDQKRYEMLLHNWNVINNNVNDGNGSSSGSMTNNNNNNTKNNSSSSIVEFINDCCISTLKKKIEHTTTYHRFFDMPHIVFFDPPWGGTNYKSKHVLSNLMLSNIELKDVIGMAFHGNDDDDNNNEKKKNNNNNNCKAVVCKVPYNYDTTKYNKNDYQTFSLSKKVKLLIFHQFTNGEDDGNREGSSGRMVIVDKKKRKLNETLNEGGDVKKKKKKKKKKKRYHNSYS